MNNIHLYRQEYIRLLWVHTQQVSNFSAKASEQRKALKLEQTKRLKALGTGWGLIKKAYLKFNFMSQLRAFNQAVELEQARLISQQQEELKKLKSSWEMKFGPHGILS